LEIRAENLEAAQEIPLSAAANPLIRLMFPVLKSVTTLTQTFLRRFVKAV
jgi:hypothetical protein